MNIKPLFVNTLEGRLRSGWRIIASIVLTMMAFLPIQWALKLAVPGAWTRAEKIDALLAVFSVIATVTIIATRKFIDKRPFQSLGLGDRKWLWKDVLTGFTFSGILVAIIIAVEVGLGWLSISVSTADWSASLPRLIVLFLVSGLAVAWWENLFFVSYLFLNLRDGCGFWYAVALNCLMNGAIHSMNPNASIVSFIGIMLIHSYEIFGFLRTRTLWLILGIHAGWNFFQGLAGFPVSGWTDIQVFTQSNATPIWIGGGEFGPEAGALILCTAAVAYSLIAAYSRITRNERQTPEISEELPMPVIHT